MCCTVRCVSNCLLKCIISVINTLIFMIGIVFIVLGALLLWGFSYAVTRVYSIENSINTMLSKFGISANGQGVMNLMQTNAYTIGIIIFGVGVVLVIFAIVGTIFVLCFDIKSLLIIIIVVMVLIAIGLLVLVLHYGLNKTNKILTPLLGYLQEDIVDKYHGLNATNPESILANVIQISLTCCGLNYYSDFDTANNFNRTMKNSAKKDIRLQFPISCCDFKSDYTIDQTTLDNCITDGSSSRKSNGCWNIVKPFVEQYLGYCFATIGVTIGVLMAVIVAQSVIVYCMIKHPNYNPI